MEEESQDLGSDSDSDEVSLNDNQKLEDSDRYEEDQEHFEEDEEEQDPYMNMTIDELKERLPAYMFKSDQEKVVYFQELNKSYYKELDHVKADN